MISNDLKALDMKLFFFGEERCIPGHSYGPGVRKVYLMHFVLSGKGIFKTQGKQYEVSKGQGFMICPNVLSYYEADYESPWQYAWMGFSGEDAETLLGSAGITQTNPVFQFDMQGEIARLISLCEMKTTLKPLHDLIKKSVLNELLVELNKGKAEAINQNVYVDESIRYISQHYSEKITINEIAEFIGINRSYLYKLFQDHFNMSPQDYLINFRIEQSKALLLETEMNIGEIAQLVGYSDQLIYSKIFKKRVGSAPKTFRKAQMRALMDKGLEQIEA